MDKIFPGLPSDPDKVEQYLKDNCDAIEEQSYSRSISTEEFNEIKESICKMTQDIQDLNEEKKEYDKEMSDKIKAIREQRAPLLEKYNTKSEFVTENCFKVIDYNAREVGFYNDEGILVYERPIQRQEMQRTFQMELREGTNG